MHAPHRETGQASLEQTADLGKYLVGGNELGCTAVDLGDSTPDLFFPRSLDLRVSFLDSGQKFLGEAHAIFGLQGTSLPGEFFDETGRWGLL